MRTSSNLVVKKPSLLVKLYLLPPFLKMLFAVALFFIISLFGFSYLQKQSVKETSQMRIRKMILEREVFEGAKSRGETQTLTGQAPTTKARYEALLKAFPPESKISDLLANITKMGTDDGLKFISFTPKPAVNQGYYSETPVDISVNGSFHQLGKFLSSIANLPDAVVVVNQFAITRATETGTPSDLLSLQFTATLYSVPPNAAEIPV
jgi:type IV pilus assembly protein PilO